jgi:hypothetical protein
LLNVKRAERCSKRATLQANVRTALGAEQRGAVPSVERKTKIIAEGNSSPGSFFCMPCGS